MFLYPSRLVGINLGCRVERRVNRAIQPGRANNPPRFPPTEIALVSMSDWSELHNLVQLRGQNPDTFPSLPWIALDGCSAIPQLVSFACRPLMRWHPDVVC
jgi:hypothetical protein